jgi:tetratricopeptide (TPR) repeat protein/RsiW-degrading membrane proteinase PrsW (M82 family)
MNIVLTSRILALPAALIGGALVALLILRLGRRTFSPRLFAVAVACGAMVAFLPAAIDAVEMRLHLSFSLFWENAFNAFVLAGLGEEGAKLAAAYFFVRPDYERRSARDLVLGVAAVALGFALLENVLYVTAAADRWPATALTRMITAVPVHALIGLVLGAGLARAETGPGGATRVWLLARAWLVAALLHGAYDFPLMLGQRAPLYPTPVNQFALVFSTTAPTLLAILYLAAVVAVCLAGARVVVWLRAPAEAAAAPGFARRAIWPRWLDRLVFARATGFVLGALLLIPATIWVGLAINAVLAGIMPMMALDALSVCAASAAVGASLLLRAAPAPARAAPRAWRRRAAVALGALAVLVAAIVAFSGAIDSARRNLLSTALVISGNSYVAQGDLDRGIENYDAALALAPDFVAALYQRALANKTYQRYERTLDDLNGAARLAPDDAAILGERAFAFENLHQSDKALADLDRALVIKPDEPALLALRAEIRLNDGDLDKAAADLDRALRLKPDLALAHAARGDLYMQQLDFDSALNELDAALRLDPTSGPTYFTRGRVRYFRGEYLAAIADLQQSNGRAPQAYSALWLYLARARAGQDGRDELIFWAGRLSRNAWPFPMIELYAGARSAPSAQAAAANADQACEAYFYISEWLLLQKLEQPASMGLREAARICPKAFIEANGAAAELKRLTAAQAPALPSAASAHGLQNGAAAFWGQAPVPDASSAEDPKPPAIASAPAEGTPAPVDPAAGPGETKADPAAKGDAGEPPREGAGGQGGDAK